MRKVIAKKSLFTYIMTKLLTIFVIYYAYNYFTNEFDIKDSMFPLDLIMFIIFMVMYIYSTYKNTKTV